MKYTNDQEKALTYRGGNLLIIACAGSGKTQVLSRRIALLVSEGVARESIVAFTFTERAAGELKSRIRKELSTLKETGELEDASLGEMYIGTIHGFSLQLLKEIDANYRNFEIIDEERQAAIVVSHYKDFGLDSLTHGTSKINIVKKFIETIGIVYREEIDVDSLSDKSLINSIKKYKEFMKSKPQCFLSFDEIIAELILQLESSSAIREQIQTKFSNIFVDEYQDVDDRQEQLVDLLSDHGQKASICAVGDDDQAIYRFRGASVRNILSFEHRYPDVVKVTLSMNFRSTHAIVEIANTAVIGCRIGRKTYEGLSKRLAKTMQAKHFNTTTDSFKETMAEYGDIWNCSFDTEEAEAKFITEKIQELYGLPWDDKGSLRGLSYADMAILCRSVNHAKVIMKELEKIGIHYIVKGATGLFEHAEIKIVYGVFCLLSDSNYIQIDPNSFNSFIFYNEVETREILRNLITNLHDSGKMPNADPNIIFAWIAQKKELFNEIDNVVSRRAHGRSRRIFPQEIFYELLEQLKANSGEVQWDDTILYNLGRFSELILGFESVHQWITPYDLKDFMYYLGCWVAKEANNINHEDIGGQNVVQISTIHQAKGLEWPVVFLPSLTNLRFPSNQRTKGTEHLMDSNECCGRKSAANDPLESRERLDEELRLWYVALTRSKKYLFLTSKVAPRCAKSRFAVSIQHNYVCGTPNQSFERPDKVPVILPVNAEILPTTFSDLRYYWQCPYDYKLRRLMQFSPGVIESYGFGQQIHNLLALLHNSILQSQEIDDTWIENNVNRSFNLRYTRGEPFEAMKNSAMKILKSYVHDNPNLSTKILSAEQPFEFIMGEALISGTVDLLNIAGEQSADNCVEIIDFKTSKTGDDLSDEERMETVTKQLLLYSIAVKDALGYDPIEAAAHFLYASRPHKLEYIILNEQEKQRTVDLIEDTVNQIKKNNFPMCNYDGTICGACDFKAICIGSKRLQ